MKRMLGKAWTHLTRARHGVEATARERLIHPHELPAVPR